MQQQLSRSVETDADDATTGHVESLPCYRGNAYEADSRALHSATVRSTEEPALHTQSSSSVEPKAELVPTGHVVLSPCPSLFLYAPGTQALHSTPFVISDNHALHT